VARLEFDVEWLEDGPRVGAVKGGGAAHQKGIVKGDLLSEINGTPTSGRSREELLPLLKARPLHLKLRRPLPMDEDQLRMELVVNLSGRQGDSLTGNIEVIGELPVVLAVPPGSDTMFAGVMEGDAISMVNGRNMRGLSRKELSSTLSARPLELTLLRSSVGSDLFAQHRASARR